MAGREVERDPHLRTSPTTAGLQPGPPPSRAERPRPLIGYGVRRRSPCGPRMLSLQPGSPRPAGPPAPCLCGGRPFGSGAVFPRPPPPPRHSAPARTCPPVRRRGRPAGAKPQLRATPYYPRAAPPRAGLQLSLQLLPRSLPPQGPPPSLLVPPGHRPPASPPLTAPAHPHSESTHLLPRRLREPAPLAPPPTPWKRSQL